MKRLVPFVLICGLAAAQELTVLDPAEAGALPSALRRIAAEQLAARREKIARIRSAGEFEAHRVEVRATLLRLMGGLPTERAPLHLRRTGSLDRGDYRLDKIIFESQPGLHVTGDLYVPKTGKPPYPAVLQPVGHTLTGKAGVMYQSLSIGLARQGFVVLTYDPIGQGERRVYWDEDLKDSKAGGPTAEHSMVGRQSLLAGESAARYRVWDGMRAIDLLQSLPEVDAGKIGVAGCSGGGTLTAYLAALDSRVQVAAPACYISAWEEQLLGTGPQDAEQQFPDQLSSGLNHADLVTAMAPKPYLICNTTEDFFPIEGSRRTYEEAKRIYALFGAEDKLAWFTAPGGHGMRRETREAIYAWMKRWLKGDPPGPAPEPEHKIEFDEDLLATITGQAATDFPGSGIAALNTRRFAQIHPSRPVKNLRDEIARVTRLPASSAPLSLRSRGELAREGCRIEKLVYDGDAGRPVPALLLVPSPERARKKAVLYVDQDGKSAGVSPGGDADQLVRLGYTVLALDPAGIGETAALSTRGALDASEETVWLALMTGRTLVGLRAGDILRGLDVLREKGVLYDGGALAFGKGLIGVALLHAAAVDSRITGVILEGSLVSYADIARSPIHRKIFDVVLPGVLPRYDLPDLGVGLGTRPVRLVNTVSCLGQTLAAPRVEAEYRAAGPLTNFKVSRRRASDTILEAYPELR